MTARTTPLQQAIAQQTQHALACGALHPIETAHTFIDDGGVRFAVRVAANLARKDAARLTPRTQPPRDPFLPYEPDLFVADLSPTHVALLNKFNVLPHHLLIVTRAFVAQETLLDRADFTALVTALREIDGLGFYNGGAVAGASQAHKHLQIVPMPLDGGDGGSRVCVPLETLFDSATTTADEIADEIADGVMTIPALPFRHAFARVDLDDRTQPAEQAAQRALHGYRALLAAAGVPIVETQGVPQQGAPYNLLVTRRWMLAVPRATEHVAGISVNSLGFAGSFFVRDAAQLDTLAQVRPMTALARVSLPR
ncbi:ATP adenylyltransferase family protein [Paraburkholderia acidisoli]|uniref:Phosphorylase n=1 Tax=Paraburkholderia acidisoli TaxID=2571748 RepID=A0A7Z2GGN0_9BURK|nr:phosphorylase [Paraburkholderia acidisoli]QGZ61109.1 phosphorylase [Paraburkholderia acidisoli]